MQRKRKQKAHVRFSIKDREIYINGGISEKTLTTVSRALVYMQRHNYNPIVVIIGRSIGGCAFSGIMIYLILRNALSPVHTVVEKSAESAAFNIFLAGKKRVMFRGSYVRPHWTTVTHFCNAIHDVADLKDELFYALALNEKIYKIIKQRIRIPQEEIQRLCAKSEFMSAEQAKQLKIATHIVSGTSFYNGKKSRNK